jgi:hypothetical protein
MEREKIIEIASDAENRSNNDLMSVISVLGEEFNKTKDLIIELTRHLDGVEELYNKVNNEMKKRMVK